MAVAKGETYAERLVDILVKRNAIPKGDEAAIKKAFKESEQEIFDDFLLEEGLVDKENLLAALADYYQVPSFDVVGYFFDTDLLQQFPKDVLLRCEMIPLEVDQNMLIMVASEPNAPDLLNVIGSNVSYDVHFRVGITEDILNAIKEFYEPSDTEVNQDEDLRVERRLAREELSMEEDAEKVAIDTGEEER